MKTLDIFWIFLKLGCTSFGGPIAHLAYFRQTFVIEKNWLSEQEYAQIVSLSQTLPGPASSQVGFALGLLRGGWLGALSAFLGFTIPSVLLLVVFAHYLEVFNSPLGIAIIQGLAILAFIVVLQGVLGMGRQLCNTRSTFAIALVSFIVLMFAHNTWTQLGIILFGALLNSVFKAFEKNNSPKKSQASDWRFSKVSISSSLLCAGIFVALMIGLPWVSPYFYEPAYQFFSSGSLVFGGGHVVLPLLEQNTVAQELLSEEHFLAGYGATQAMPGPMFSFAAYLGFLIPSSQPPFVAALLACLFIFLPGFLLIAWALPMWQRLVSNKRFDAAVSGANAAVVGLLAATLYDPIFVHAIQSKTDFAIAALGFGLLTRFASPVLLVVLLCVASKVLLALLI